MTLDEYAGYSGHLSEGWTAQGLREHLAQHHHESLSRQAAIYQEVLGRAIDDGTLRGHAALLGRGDFPDSQAATDASRASSPSQEYPGGDLPRDTGGPSNGRNRAADLLQSPRPRLDPGSGPECNCAQPEVSSRLQALYQDIWGRPIDSAYLDYYTFLLSTDGTLADVRADMQELHLQTVVLPVLIARLYPTSSTAPM